MSKILDAYSALYDFFERKVSDMDEKLYENDNGEKGTKAQYKEIINNELSILEQEIEFFKQSHLY